MMLKLKPYESSKNFKKEIDSKTDLKTQKILNILSKHEKFVELQPIREIEFRSTRKMRTSSVLKTPAKKMNIDHFVKQQNDKLVEEQLKEMEIENNRRQYLPSIVETEKTTFPFYNEALKGYVQ